MKASEIETGGRYYAKVSGKVVTVRIVGESRYGGWEAVNEETMRSVRIKTAARLRGRRRAVVSAGLDGRSEPMLRYADEMALPDSARSIVSAADRERSIFNPPADDVETRAELEAEIDRLAGDAREHNRAGFPSRADEATARAKEIRRRLLAGETIVSGGSEETGEIDGLRRLAAELEILGRFDAMRQSAGHDYGAGQRAAELGRRSRALDGRDPLCKLEPPTDAELVAAFERIAQPRIARLVTESYRSQTPATKRTIETWRRLARRIDSLRPIRPSEQAMAEAAAHDAPVETLLGSEETVTVYGSPLGEGRPS